MSQIAEGEAWYQNLLGITNEAKKYGNKKIMWEDVQKVVLQSQPPRMEDIPSMTAFCKKYAGLPTGVFVEDLVELVKAYVPSSRIVAGSFFDHLNALKFPINQSPAHVINAVLFAHACHEHVVDGYARGYSKDQIKQLDSAKMKADVKEAN